MAAPMNFFFFQFVAFLVFLRDSVFGRCSWCARRCPGAGVKGETSSAAPASSLLDTRALAPPTLPEACSLCGHLASRTEKCKLASATAISGYYLECTRRVGPCCDASHRLAHEAAHPGLLATCCELCEEPEELCTTCRRCIKCIAQYVLQGEDHGCGKCTICPHFYLSSALPATAFEAEWLEWLTTQDRRRGCTTLFQAPLTLSCPRWCSFCQARLYRPGTDLFDRSSFVLECWQGFLSLRSYRRLGRHDIYLVVQLLGGPNLRWDSSQVLWHLTFRVGHTVGSLRDYLESVAPFRSFQGLSLYRGNGRLLWDDQLLASLGASTVGEPLNFFAV